VLDAPSLDGIYTKMVRAYQHLDALNDAVKRFTMSRPHVPVVEPDDDPDWIRISVVLKDHAPDIAAISGELVQSLRHALDHLAWQLVLDARAKPRMGGFKPTQFPIFTKPKRDRNGRRIPARIFPGVSKEAAAFVDWIQPCTPRPDLSPFDPKTHHLAVLNELSNEDKHRTFHTVLAHIADPYLFFQVGDRRIDIERWRGNHKCDAPLTRVRKSDIPAEPNVKVGLTATAKIAIEVRGGSIVPIERQDDWRVLCLEALPDAILTTTILPLVATMTNL
jgi:hypothetical protein